MLMDVDDERIYERFTQNNFLCEMALLNVKLMSDVVDSAVKVGKHAGVYSFAPADQRIMNKTNTSYVKALPKLIGANIGYDFAVIINDVEGLPPNIPATPNVITVVVDPTPFHSSDNDHWNRAMPLTPHIVCHKIGHALTNDDSPFREKVTLEVVVPLLQYKLKAAQMSETLSDEKREEMIHYIQQWITMFQEEKYQQGIDGCSYSPCELGKFKSAKVSLIESLGDISIYDLEPGEFFNEVIARYIMTGQINFNPWPNAQMSNSIANYLKTKIHEMLDMCVGRVIGEFTWKL